MPATERIHGTVVAIGGEGVLLRGASGAGKSDLALRLVMGGPHAAAAGRAIGLVADDQVVVEARDGRAYARAPEMLAGRIEARGIGILEATFISEAALALVIDLVPREAVDRLPERDMASVCGCMLPRVALHAFDVSAPLKVILSLDRSAGRLESEP